MIYFTEDFIDFFIELAANNKKEWFDLNRNRYENNVKKPFEKFTEDLITEVKKLDKEIDITYKDAIFRINKDVRFSKDKTPYKINRSAIISAKGRKDKSYPGLYIELGPEQIAIYGGVYMPDKDQTYDIRTLIKENLKEFTQIVTDKAFVKTFKEVRGDKNKIIHAEFKEIAEKQPLILNKQWYWYAHLSPEKMLEKDFINQIISIYKNSIALEQFFKKAFK